jgi:hypothetical protein
MPNDANPEAERFGQPICHSFVICRSSFVIGGAVGWSDGGRSEDKTAECGEDSKISPWVF